MFGANVPSCGTIIQSSGHPEIDLPSTRQVNQLFLVSFSPSVSFRIQKTQHNSSCVIAEVILKNGAPLEIKPLFKTMFVEGLQSICNAKLIHISENDKIVETIPFNSQRQFESQPQKDISYTCKCFINENNHVQIGFATFQQMVDENQSPDSNLIPALLSLLEQINPSLILLLQRIGIIRASFQQKFKINREIEFSKKSFKKIIKNQIQSQPVTSISILENDSTKNSTGVFQHLHVIRQERLNQNEMVFKRGGYFDIVKRKMVVFKPKDSFCVLQCKNLAQKKLSKRKRPNTIFNYEGKIPKELKLLHCLNNLSLYELNFFAKYYFLNLSTRTDLTPQQILDESQCNGKDTVSTMSEETQVTTLTDIIYMDFYDENLEEYIIRKGRLDIFQVLCLVRQILESVQSLHKVGIVHRDIKPANFMIEKLQDGRIKTKLIDFGESAHIASEYDSSQILGFSTQYAPIECTYQCKEGYNAKQIDLWSVGVLIYKLTTNRMPVTYSKCFKSDIKYEWPTSLTFFITQYGRGRWSLFENMLVELSLMFMRVKPAERLTLEKGLLILDQIENMAKFYTYQK